MTFTKALNRNNEGVELLRSGKFEDARKAFHDALVQLKNLARPGSSASECAFPPPLVVERQPIQHPLPSKHYIYKNALVANVDVQPLQNETNKLGLHQVQNSPFRPVEVVIYNLGLVHHFRITGNQDRSMKRYRQICAIYGKGLQTLFMLQTKSRRGNMLSWHPLRGIIILGIINNVGVLNHEFQDYRQARICFDLLKKHVNNADPRVLGDEAHEGMLKNIWLLQEPNTEKATEPS